MKRTVRGAATGPQALTARQRRRGGAVAAVAAACALAGCNLIVGVGDYVVGDAGTSTEGGNNIVDGAVADAGTDSATGADVAVVPREGGAADSRPTQDAPGAEASGQNDFQKLVSSCVLAVSCDPYFFATNISECITEDYLQSVSGLSCLSNIQDCAGYYACRGIGFASLADCPASGAAAKCDTGNNRAINCSGPGNGIVRNCAKLGGTCGTHPDGTGGTVADCVVVPSCSDTDGLAHCSGNSLYTCSGGRGYGQDCGPSDATCSTGSSGASCFLNAPSCSAAGWACTGAMLGWCTSLGQHFNCDCSRAALSCSIDDAGTGSCVAPNPTTCSEACGVDGKTMTVCIGGAPRAVDCSQYSGFTQCT